MPHPARLAFAVLLAAAPVATRAQTPVVPAAFGVTGRVPIMSLHAEGAQIYECKADRSGRLMWSFREPVAILLDAGRTVGRHYGGPTWELTDGSQLQGKLITTLPGASSGDVALLKLDVVGHRGVGALSDATVILRLNTRGGGLSGACGAPGELRPEPYSADYVFLR